MQDSRKTVRFIAAQRKQAGEGCIFRQGRDPCLPEKMPLPSAALACGLRNHAYPGVASARTLVELAAVLAARGTAFELPERG